MQRCKGAKELPLGTNWHLVYSLSEPVYLIMRERISFSVSNALYMTNFKVKIMPQSYEG